MPLLTEDEIKQSGQYRQGLPNVVEDPTAPESTFSETLSAAFKRDNSVFNQVSNFVGPSIDRSGRAVGFNPFENEGQLIAGYEDYAEEFVGANSEKDVELIKNKIDYELDQKRIIEEAPTTTALAATFMANVIDPLAFVPIIKGVQTASKTAQITSGAAQGVAFGTTAGTARELIAQQAQVTRAPEESFLNIATEAAFGGILGGIAGGLTPGVRAASRELIKRELADDGLKIFVEDGKAVVKRDVGAAQAADIDDDALASINETLAKVISGPKFLQSPVLRGALSRSKTVQSVTQRLFKNNFITKGNIEGKAIDYVAEKIYRQDMSELMNLLQKSNDDYLKYVGTGQVKAILARPEGKISKGEFNARISRVLHTGEADSISAVNASAKRYREVLDNYKTRLQELKLIGEDVDPNFLSRIYNVNYLNTIEGEKDFYKKMGSWLRDNNIDGTPRQATDNIDEVVEREIEELLTSIRREKDSQLAFDNLLNKSATPLYTSPLKGRSIKAPYEVLEPFLEKDVDMIMRNYVNRASSLISTHKALGKFLGDESITDPLSEIIRGIRSEADQAIADIRIKMKDTKSKSAKTRLEKQEKQTRDDFKEAEDLMRRLYSTATGTLHRTSESDKYLDFLRNFQYVRLLGGVTISSIQELAMPIFTLGIKEFGSSYLAAVKNMKAFKGSVEQLKDMNVGLDMMTNNLLRYMSETGLESGRYTNNFERGIDAVVDGFSKATGIDHFTYYGRAMAGHIAMSKIVRVLKKGATKKETTDLAQAGIDASLHKRVLNEFNKYGEEIDGSFLPNIHMWKDAEAKEAFRSAVQGFIDSTVITPGRGDLPFWVQESSLGKVIFQFKSFMSAATNKVTIRGLQNKDAQTVVGLMALMSLASLSGIAHDKIAGRKTPDSVEEIISESLSRSGILGLMGTSLLDAGLSQTNPRTRRFGVDTVGAFLGPSASFLRDAGKSIGRVTDGRITNSDARAVAGLLPFQNLHVLNYLKNRLFPREQ